MELSPSTLVRRLWSVSTRNWYPCSRYQRTTSSGVLSPPWLMVCVCVLPLYQRVWGDGAAAGVTAGAAAAWPPAPCEFTVAAARQMPSRPAMAMRALRGCMFVSEQVAGRDLHRPRTADGGCDATGGAGPVGGERGRRVGEHGRVQCVVDLPPQFHAVRGG